VRPIRRCSKPADEFRSISRSRRTRKAGSRRRWTRTCRSLPARLGVDVAKRNVKHRTQRLHADDRPVRQPYPVRLPTRRRPTTVSRVPRTRTRRRTRSACRSSSALHRRRDALRASRSRSTCTARSASVSKARCARPNATRVTPISA
jgi:hypothetical protein